MDWIEIITKALNYIEENLQDPSLCAVDVAKSVNVSYGHFSRAFNVLTKMTVSEYIRNRRLSIAGDLLKNSDKSVLDVSLDVGYESPEAFSKAFKRFHNVNPNESKKAELKKFYPLQISLTLSQEPPLSYTIEDKGEIILAGNYESVSSDSISTTMIWSLYDSKGYLDELYGMNGFESIVGV
ncbi:helix-turn-helix domain-containing protein [Clostridium sp.]|uniref:helix-turn-helix domain-containing protein n=1 Tax=Clostridium sp. TaxID=1506 RepID=UPI003F3DA305